MTTRLIITVLVLALAAPSAAKAQQVGKGARIGYVTINPVAAAPQSHAAFRDELRRLGYAEGRNLFIEYRSWEGRAERLPQIGNELASLGVDLIVASNTATAVPIVAATNTIPVVVIQGRRLCRCWTGRDTGAPWRESYRSGHAVG